MAREKSPEELAEQQFNEIQQLKKDYLNAFGSEAGKRVLIDLEKKCFIHQTTFSPVEGRTLFNEGMRFVVVNIKNILNMDIETIRKFIREE